MGGLGIGTGVEEVAVLAWGFGLLAEKSWATKPLERSFFSFSTSCLGFFRSSCGLWTFFKFEEEEEEEPAETVLPFSARAANWASSFAFSSLRFRFFCSHVRAMEGEGVGGASRLGGGF